MKLKAGDVSLTKIVGRAVIHNILPSNCRSKKNPYRCEPNGGDGPLKGETFTAVDD